MACPNRGPGSPGSPGPPNWDPNMNSAFTPNSISTSRGAQQRPANEYQAPMKPQRLFGSGSNPGAPSLPYAGYGNQPAAEYREMPEYYQFSPQRPTTPSYPSTPPSYPQTSPSYPPSSSGYPPRSRTIVKNPNVPYRSTKIVYETSNVAPVEHEPISTTYSQRPSGWNQFEQACGTPQDAQPKHVKYPPGTRPGTRPQSMPNESLFGYNDEHYQQPQKRSSAGYRTPMRNEAKSWETPNSSNHNRSQRSNTLQAGTQNKPPCPGSCSSGKDKSDKLYHDFVSFMRNTIISAIVRRKRVRSAMEQSIKWNQEELDCRQKRALEKAENQMESNFRSEIIAIYNDLMNRRKQLHHEMSHERTSRGSLVSINAPINKPTTFVNPLNQTELKDEEKNISNEFTKIVVDKINEYCARDIELAEEFASLTENDTDSDTMSAYHQEYIKQADQMEEDFINTWEEYEANKCGCSSDDEENDLMIEMGVALQEVLAKQFKMCEELEKKLKEECSECQSSKTKSYPHSDRLELNNVHVDIMNDLWYAMDSVKQIMEDRPSGSGENYSSIFRALLAIYRRCHGQVKIMLENHYDQRRVHQVENLSSIFVDEWTRLRKETIDELKSIIDSLDYSSSTNMTCQERRLKKMQDMEKAEIMEKYRAEQESRPCRSKEYEGELNDELTALEKSHIEQWDTILWNKLQKKVDEIEVVYPKESKEVCVQTCSNKKHPEQMDDIDEEGEGACFCTPKSNGTTERKRSIGGRNAEDFRDSRETKSDSNVKICTNGRGKGNAPDLGELTDIEVQEMKELQKNLRQWQLARRNLLESINRGLKQ